MTEGATIEGTRLPTAVPSSIKCKKKPLMKEESDRAAEKCGKQILNLLCMKSGFCGQNAGLCPCLLSHIDLHLDYSWICCVLPSQIVQ